MRKNRLQEESYHSRGVTLISYMTPVICGLLLIIALKYIFLIGYVPSASMEPSINEGSYIFADRIYGELNRGDIVVFVHDHTLNVKRIAALPGDKVTIIGKDLRVPEGCYYMLGDNASNSIDSRYWADPFLPAPAILAKVWLVN